MEGQAAAARRLSVLSGQVSAQVGLQPCAASSSARLLEGRVAIITGAGNGIGEASSKLLASQGAAIVVSDLDEKAAQRVAQAIEAAGGRAIAVQADVTQQDAPSNVVSAAIKAFGRIDILVNNAGFTWDGVIQKMTPKQWETMFAVHCTAPFRFIQAVEPHMRGAGKREVESGQQPTPRYIINISSTTGQINYATAKAGVVGLTKSVAKEWGPYGVRCNAIAYGLIDTRLTGAKESGAFIEVDGQKVALGIPGANDYWTAVKSMIPLRRQGSVEEAAGAIMMLVTPWSDYVTGQVLEVNGGSFM